jgi:hypothetical protein
MPTLDPDARLLVLKQPEKKLENKPNKKISKRNRAKKPSVLNKCCTIFIFGKTPE